MIFSKVLFIQRCLWSTQIHTDNVHLEGAAQTIVANYMMQWLDKNNSIPGKVAEGEGLVPLFEALSKEGIYTEPDRI